MLILRRCSWHSRNFGYTKYLGIKISLNKLLQFGITDTICPACLRKLESEIEGNKLARKLIEKHIKRGC